MYIYGICRESSTVRLRPLNQSRATRCCATCCPWCGGEDKIHSHSFRASWCAPAGPLHNVKETAPWRCAFVFIVFALLASELAVGVITTKRPQLSSRPFLSLYAERTRIFFRFRHSSVGQTINHLHSGFCALPSITRL